MKKLLHIFFLTLLSISVTTFFVSCEEDEDTPSGSYKIAFNQNLIGKWTFMDESETCTLTFYTDGKGTEVRTNRRTGEIDYTVNFNWTYNENAKTVVCIEPGYEDDPYEYLVYDGFLEWNDSGFCIEKYYKEK